ncbi:twin-arginine translocase subunit TatC [Shimazuella sp. AN120528]|uniref:twin-arginine translocase subunit TatC n=1 Tax=Shimazuella soli TaxID=1892854 RepID=UPI001F0D8DA1|nr:twin-arginine translocase subunit TatC [Shimazuella soli]MCH5585409.1 twin-arginine translocase subunit TatC [Shimazuella soli]
MSEEEYQPLTDHLIELRRRLIWVLATFVVGLVVSFIYAADIFKIISKDANQHFALYALSPADSFKIYMQISLVAAFVLALPVLLYHLWQFVRPGLEEREQKAALIYIPVAFLLFIGGLAFGYFLVFPLMIDFLSNISKELGVKQMYGIYQYISFMMNVIVPLALLFLLPVVVLFLTRLRLITPSLLIKVRRVAYMILIVIALIITPDLLSNFLVAVPLILLYEVSIGLSVWLYRRIERESLLEEKENED